MVFQPLTQQYLVQVGELLHHYYTLEGKHYSPATVKRLLQSSSTDKPFILVHGKRVLGYVTLRFLDTNAEIHHFIVRDDVQKYDLAAMLLQEVIEYCERHSITRISTVIPSTYTTLFTSLGFTTRTPMMSMVKERVPEQQTSLALTLTKLTDTAYVQDIMQKTSVRLRKLRTKK